MSRSDCQIIDAGIVKRNSPTGIIDNTVLNIASSLKPGSVALAQDLLLNFSGDRLLNVASAIFKRRRKSPNCGT